MSKYDDKGLPIRKTKESSGNVTCRFDDRTNQLMAELRNHWTQATKTNMSQTETLRACIWHAAELVLPNLFKQLPEQEEKQTEGCQNCYPVKDGADFRCDACGRGLVRDGFSETMEVQGFATPIPAAKPPQQEQETVRETAKKRRTRKG